MPTTATNTSTVGRHKTDSGSCNLRRVLEEATADLANAEYPGLLCLLFDPVRDKVLTPALRLATNAVPVSSNEIPVPFVDKIGSCALGFAFGFIKYGYGFLSPVNLEDRAKDEVETDSLEIREEYLAKRRKQEVLRMGMINRILEVPNVIKMTTLQITGFVLNALLDIISSPGEKMSDWVESIKELEGFLVQSGIDKELIHAFARENSYGSMRIISRIETIIDLVDSRRERVLMDEDQEPIFSNEIKRKSFFDDVEKYMKYATAAYGISMIRSDEPSILLATWGAEKLNIRKYYEKLLTEITKRQIVRYLRIEKDDIKFITPPGGDSRLLRHFVAVDRDAKAVVLSIRGTFSVSGAVIDIKGFTKQFCSGLAHRGIAEQTENLLNHNETMEAVKTALHENKGYELIITGHSLGAGAACLMNIKIHHDEELPGISVRCFGFASPPVFVKPTESHQKVNQAISRCVCFINENDCIPFLSGDAIRRLANTLIEVNEFTSEMNIVRLFLTVRGVEDPCRGLVKVVKRGSEDLKIMPGADRLEIPAAYILWMMYDTDENRGEQFDLGYCDPSKISTLSIFLSKAMIRDHMPPRYLKAIRSVRLLIDRIGCDYLPQKNDHSLVTKTKSR